MVGIEIGLNTHRTCFKFTQDLKKDGCFQFQASLIWFEPVWTGWKFELNLDQSTRNQGISACTCKILFLKGFMAINNWIYRDSSRDLFLNIWPLNYLKIKEQVCFPIKLLRCTPNYLVQKYLEKWKLFPSLVKLLFYFFATFEIWSHNWGQCYEPRFPVKRSGFTNQIC